MQPDITQWVLACIAAVLIGMTKTGLPGLGILAITFLVLAYGAWEAIGITLPLLIFADIFAVLWYKRHAQWDKLIGLLPWVLVGLAIGAGALRFFGQSASTKALLNPVIGGIVLVMLAVTLVQHYTHSVITPRSKVGMISAGTAAGFATTVSNAAGPIMSIYLTAQGMPKEQFMGTIAWYFFLINLTKVPIYASQGLFSQQSLLLNLYLLPAIVLGVFAGRWLLPRIPQKAFNGAVLLLAALGAINLLIKF